MSADSARSFLDSNVIVYAHDADAGVKHDRAQSLLRELWARESLCLSIQVLQEFFATVTRRLSQTVETKRARTAVAAYARATVHQPAPGDVLAAIDLHHRYGISFWDAMIVRSASALGCEVLYTEDLNAGQRYDGVLAVDPFA